jgi:hypothetical protein
MLEDDEPLNTGAPRVEACIDAVMKRFPGISKAAQARYFEEVQQHLGPLARELERENIALRNAYPICWVVKWVSRGEQWFESHMSELSAIDKARRVGGIVIPCAAIESGVASKEGD